MGGHGGLNILPQKSWNVYNFENRERVRKDEEAAAREEQERERRDREQEAEIRWQKLKESNAKKAGRQIIGDGEDEKSPEKSVAGMPSVETEAPRQIKMFGGCVIATSAVAITSVNDAKERRTANLLDWDEFEKDLQGCGGSRCDLERKGTEKQGSWRTKDEKSVVERARRELKERIKPVVREADDEHYKLGYGCTENDKKRPWYTLSKSSIMNDDDDDDDGVPADGANGKCISEATGKDAGKRKKTLDELRDERLKREQKERERTRKLLFSKADASFGSHIAGRRKYYNSSYGNAR